MYCTHNFLHSLTWKLLCKNDWRIFPTWNGASFSTVTPGVTINPTSLISRATPGPVISEVIMECEVPSALGVLFTLILEWEDALLSSGRLALWFF